MIRSLICVLFLLTPIPVWAISNAGFETGDLTGWQTIGLVSTETASFGSGPSEGAFQAFLNANDGFINQGTVSLSELEIFLGVPTDFVKAINPTPRLVNGHVEGERDNSGGPPRGSAMKQTFLASAGQTVSFQWNFLTSDGPFSHSTINPESSKDVSFATLVGPGFLAGSTLSNTVDEQSHPNEFGQPNPFLPSPTLFINETGFRQLSFTAPSTGTYTVGFGVTNIGLIASNTGSGLLVDHVSVGQHPVPEPSTWLLMGTGLVGLVAWRWKQKFILHTPHH